MLDFSTTSETLRISLILLPESSMMSLASVLDVMRAANRVSRRVLFNWRIMTLDGEPAVLSCGIHIPADSALDQGIKGDILIVIGGFNQQKHVNQAALKQIKRCMQQYRIVGGIEAGSWVLARAGKLNHLRATTHWEDLEDFALAFPHIHVQPHRFVIDKNVFTTGGASPSFDFMLHLIRLRFGQHVALEVSSAFIYDAVHTGHDTQPVISLGELEHQEPRVARVIRLMEQHLEDTLPVKVLAEQVNLSERMLTYLFHDALQLSPGQFYLRLRLQAARRMVLDTGLPMQEIAIRTGFNSLAAFSRQFKQYYEMTASQCRKEKRENL